jgi:HD-GYP domain-containing protein (c-di-GMP phosphodiesterase class II)
MIKKIAIDQLTHGMFVQNFNCGWLEHPFLTNTAMIKTDDDVQKVKGFGIRELYIDTDKGLDVGDALTLEEAHKKTTEEMRVVLNWDRTEVVNPIEVAQEMPKAKRVKQDAKKVITDIMSDIKMGKQVEVEKAEHVVEAMVDSIFRNADALTSLSRIKEADAYLFMHSVNVCVLMISFCRFMGISRDVIVKVGVGGLLHDIGKTKMPLGIINKPSHLTEKEFEIMQKHATYSRDILMQTTTIGKEAVDVAYQHHERFDGTGYPNKLDGDHISQFGQMASIADVYDAITTDRVYHKGVEPADAIRMIFEWGKHHFREDLTHRFIKCVGIYPVGTLVRLASGMLAVVAEPGKTNLLRPIVRIVYDTNTHRLVKPHDLDLGGRDGSDAGDRIVGYENPIKRNINPLDFVNLHGIF